MPAFTRYILNFVFYGLAAGVIAVAFLVSATRMLLPLADQYRDEFQALISDSLGYPVHIGKLNAKWRGVYPSIALEDIVIHDLDMADSDWIRLQQMEAWFSPYQLLLGQNIPFNRFRLSGAAVDLEQGKDGLFKLNGKTISSEGELSLRYLRDLIANIKSIDLEKVELSVKGIGGQPGDVRVRAQRLEFHQQGDQIRLSGLLQRPEDDQGYASFIALLPDTAETFETANLTFHLKVDTGLGIWLKPWLPDGLSVKTGHAAVQAWGNTTGLLLQDLDVQSVVTDLSWQRTLVSSGEPLLPGKIKGFSNHVRWQRTGQGWSLVASPLLVASQTNNWEPGRLVLVHQDAVNGEQQRLSGTMDFLNLQDMATWASTWVDDFVLREKLHELSLQGKLESVVFTIAGPVTHPQQYTINAKVEDLAFRGVDGLPGVSGMDGLARFTQADGEIVLDSREFQLMFPVLFRRDLYAEQISGVVRWHRSEDLWQLGTDELILQNRDIETRTRFRLSQTVDDALPVLDLQSHFRNGNIENAWKYLPTGIMATNVVSWLDRALVTGRVPHGSMIYFGSLQDFPYDRHEGIFEVRFAVEDGILDYGEGWPRVDDFAADVGFIGSGFETQVVKGIIHGLNIRGARVSISDLIDSSDLVIDGYLNGAMSEALNFIADVSANEQVSAAVRDIQAAGSTGLALNLVLPLDDLSKYRLEGAIDLSGNAIHMSKWSADLEQLDGKLHYRVSDSGGFFNSDGITGKFNDRDASIRVASSRTRDGGVRNSVYIDSVLDIRKTVSTYTSQTIPIEGITPVLIRIDTDRFRDRPDRISLNLRSNLKGVELNLPDGFGKTASEERSFALDWDLVSAASIRELSLAYGEDVKAEFNIRLGDQGVSLVNGVLNIGYTYTKKPETGLSVFVDRKSLHLDHWWELLENSPEYTGTGGQGLIQEAHIRLDELIYSGNHYKNFTLLAEQGEKLWGLNISSDSLKGKVRIPVDFSKSRFIEAELEKFSWDTPESGNNTQYRDPRKLPPFSINSKQFFFNGKDMGGLAVRASTVENGLVIDSVQLSGEVFSVKGSGAWLYEDNWHHSRFNVDLLTVDLGRALRHFGFEDSMEGGEAEAKVNAEWVGTPAEFELSRLDGDIQVAVHEGRLKDLDAGGGRIFGLLSISRLPRRLLLDFSDLFGEGFKFDRISGGFSIADGDAYTNDLSLTSSAANIEISGRIGLANKDYDQVAVVSPKMASSLTLIGGLAGGPGVALGMWVADRLIGKQIDALGSVSYSITGPWSDPEVVKVSDAGTDDSTDTDADDIYESESDEF